MSFDKKTGVAGRNAFELFPELMKKKTTPEKKEEAAPPSPSRSPSPRPKLSGNKRPEPPPPPDISWLRTGKETEALHSADGSPEAMLLMPDGKTRRLVAEILTEKGYRLARAGSEEEAIEKTAAVDLAMVVMQEGFCAGPLESSEFHRHIARMPMAKRRTLYYIMIGPRFHTAYDLQALALSANLLVNDRDTDKMALLLRRGMHEHEALFRPYLDVLREYGKR